MEAGVDVFRFLTIMFAGASVLLAAFSFRSWRRWSRSKRTLAWAVSILMFVNGYAAFEALQDNVPGGARSVMISTAMGAGLIGVIIAIRDDTKDASDKRGR